LFDFQFIFSHIILILLILLYYMDGFLRGLFVLGIVFAILVNQVSNETIKNLKTRRNRKMKKILVLALAMGLVMALGGVALAAGNADVAVSATVQGVCKFLTGGTLAFGALDPSVPGPVTVTPLAASQPQFWCTNGTAYTITDNDGVRGNHTMIGPSGNLIQYSFNYSATGNGTGRTSPITMDISGTVQYDDFKDKLAGDYSDTVRLTINP
jgi:spore coat protein U-like protein